MSNGPKGWVEFQVIDEIHNPKGWWCIDITKEPIVCVEDYTNSAGCHVRTVKDGRRVNETRTEVLNAVSQAQQDVVIRDGYSQVQGTQPESVTTYYPDIKEEIKQAKLEILDNIEGFIGIGSGSMNEFIKIGTLSVELTKLRNEIGGEDEESGG